MKPLSFFYEARKRRCPGALCAVMGGAINNPNGLGDLIIGRLDDPISAAPDHIECRGVRDTYRHAVGESER